MLPNILSRENEVCLLSNDLTRALAATPFTQRVLRELYQVFTPMCFQFIMEDLTFTHYNRASRELTVFLALDWSLLKSSLRGILALRTN